MTSSPSGRITALALAASCALAPGPARAADPGSAAGALLAPRPDHVVIVIEENKGFEQIIGNDAAPYLKSLVREAALLTQSYAVAHPSQPNYLALFSGSTQGVTDDSCPHQFTGDNLAADLERHHMRFALYAEALPEVGFNSCIAGRYFRKHNPAANWQGANVKAASIRPLTDFPSDYAKLPEVSFVIPDIINDMHDDVPPASIATGDAWLKEHLSGYAKWALRHNSLLIITWDEDDSSHGNRIATLLVGEMIQPGLSSAPVNHYDVLRTLTVLYGLEPLGGLDSTHPITGIWRGTPAAQ